jgi:pyridoxamine 5'-phosphate oxidase
MEVNIANIRTDYTKASLEISDVDSSPLVQFRTWFYQAVKSEIEEVNAFVLSTINLDGKPSSRVVLLKELSEEGFVFFTNYSSHKGQEIASNPFGAINFFWKEIERQVRIEGKIIKVDAAVSDEYYMSRPEGSRIGAWSSPQSQVIPNREFLDKKVQENELRFSKEAISRPPFWGGYCLIPDKIEFWQGRSSRLHDRILYTLENDNWKIERLAP